MGTASAVMPGPQVRMRYNTPGVRAGTVGTRCDASPSGHTSKGLFWIDFGEPIQWSHGQSESTGFWAGQGEFELVSDAEKGGT